jgi:uncharacterized protein (DUF427 family)
MTRAIWNNKVVAEASSTDIHRVEGNVYFPPYVVKREYLRPIESHIHCPWKGKKAITMSRLTEW